MHHPLFELCGSVVTPGSVSCLAETEESCLCFAHCNGNEPLQRLCRKVKHFWNISLTIEEELGLEVVGRLLYSGTDTTSFSLCFLNISNVCYDFFSLC